MFSQIPVKDLDETVKKGLVDGKVPGMALAIVKDSKIVYAKGFGYKNVNDKTPVDQNTIFAIGSCSKAFVAAMVGILVHAGKVGWDENVMAKIFKPLGMTSSSTSIREFKPDGNISTPHILENGKQIPIPWLNIDDVGPAGCINSTVVDMARWIQLHLISIWALSVFRTDGPYNIRKG